MRFIDLEDTVPWGRTFDEYVAMFALTERDLAGRILDCGAGPASFTAEAAARGSDAIACDPLYRFTGEQIRARFDAIEPDMLARTIADRDLFVWSFFGDPEANVGHRRLALERFLADYAAGAAAGRYVTAELPALPFPSGSFDLALSSHLLFLYSTIHSFEFHLAAMRELLRVAREVRVFPLQDLSARPSVHVDPVVRALEARGCRCEIVPVDYEFQRGACRMLVARRGGQAAVPE